MKYIVQFICDICAIIIGIGGMALIIHGILSLIGL